MWASLPDKGYPNPLVWETYAMRLAWFTEEAPAQAWLASQRTQHGLQPSGRLVAL